MFVKADKEESFAILKQKISDFQKDRNTHSFNESVEIRRTTNPGILHSALAVHRSKAVPKFFLGYSENGEKGPVVDGVSAIVKAHYKASPDLLNDEEIDRVIAHLDSIHNNPEAHKGLIMALREQQPSGTPEADINQFATAEKSRNDYQFHEFQKKLRTDLRDAKRVHTYKKQQERKKLFWKAILAVISVTPTIWGVIKWTMENSFEKEPYILSGALMLASIFIYQTIGSKDQNSSVS